MSLTLAATEAAAASPLHINGADATVGTAALVVAGILIWRTWTPKFRHLLFLVAGAALAAPLLGSYMNTLTRSAPDWLPVWALGLAATVFLVVELFPHRQHRSGLISKVKTLHHGDWIKRGQITGLPTHAVAFVYPLLAGTLPGPLGRAVPQVANAIAVLPMTLIHSGLGVS